MSDGTRAFDGVLVAAVYALGKESGELRLTETDGEPVSRYGLRPRYALSDHAPVTDACRSGRPLWLDAAFLAAYRQDGEDRRAGQQGRDGRDGRDGRGGQDGAAGPAGGAGQVSMGVLPLGAGPAGGPVGCLVVVRGSERGFDPDRRSFLELYAEHVGEGLETDGRPTPRKVLTGAMDRSRIGAFTLVLTTGMVEANARALELMGIEPAAFDGRVESLLAHAVPEDVPALMAMVEPVPVTAAGRELEFRVRRVSGELRWLHLRCRGLPGTGGAAERVLGLLADASRLRPSADEVSRVQRLSATLATAVTVREVSEVAVAAMRELGADRVALAETEGDRLVVTVLDPDEPAAWPEPWRADWPNAPTHALPTLEHALREGRMRLWGQGTALEPGLAGVGPGGLAVLPLPADGRVAGACLIGWDQRHEFGPEQRFLLTAAAGLIGQAVMRARAYDAQHELAAMLQRSLLPRTLPTLPGGVAVARYLPATAGLDVGGDWYDVIPLTDRYVALVIGDVQGHSAAAATIMGQIRTAIRAYAVEGHSPDVVVSHANRLMVGMETDLFATCCYAALDLEEGDTWLVRAGHLPPLVLAPGGETQEVDVEGGPPLGVVADAEFPMTTIGLEPGAVLALVTDGLVESSRVRVEDGLRRVRDLLSATGQEDLGHLADVLLGDTGRRDDDVALLLTRYDGMKVKPRRASWTLWRLPDAVGHARRFTGRTLRKWRVTAEGDAVLLAVSELVTNALVHTQGQVRLDLTLSGDRLRVAVSDSSPRTPAKSTDTDWEATGGRGILLVEAVSEAWGSVPLSGGKQVWAEISVTPVPQQDEPPGGEGRRPLAARLRGGAR